ncbi:TPA: helix-turn-helix domain-containing protein [Enterococcus faecalis]|nr:helix-turn-helix domain-containing protein [Enterococcus faecalis]
MGKENYFQFISEDTHIEILVAEYLDNNPRYIGTEELCMQFNISMFTTRKIIKMLELDIENYDRPGYAIDVTTRGVRLIVPLEDDLKNFFIYVTCQSPNVQILISIFFGRFKSITQYSLENHMSEATVRRAINVIRKVLKKLDIEITNKTFSFKGDEKQIRMFLLLFFWRLNRGLSWPFASVSEKSMELLVNQLCRNLNISNLSTIKRKRLMYFFAIIVIRINDAKFIKTDKVLQYTKNLEKIEVSIKASGFIRDLSKSELYFIYTMFKGFCMFSDMNEEIDYEIEHSLPAGMATQYVLEKLNDEFPEFIENNRVRARDFLFATHTFANELHNFSSDMNGYFYFKFMDKYFPNISERLVMFFKQARKDTKLDLFDEHTFLLIHYNMLLAQLPTSLSIEKSVKVYVETALPSVLEDLLIEQVHSYFKIRYNIQMLNGSKKINREDVDMLLVTIPLEEYKSEYPNAQIIAVNRDLKPVDYEKIESVLSKLLDN